MRRTLVISYTLSIASLLASSHAHAQGVCAHQPPGLVSWWKGEGDTTDFVNGNDGSTPFFGNPAGFLLGKVNDAFSFDLPPGFSLMTSPNVRIPDDPSLDIALGEDFTIDFWYRLGTYPQDTPVGRPISLIHKSRVSSNNPQLTVCPGAEDPTDVPPNPARWRFYISAGGQIVVELSDGTNAKQLRSKSGTDYKASMEWHHVALTREGQDGIATLYVDGVKHTTIGGLPFTGFAGEIQNQASILIGLDPCVFNPDPAFLPFDGQLDEIEFGKAAADDDTIKAIFEADFKGKCGRCVVPPPGMVSWWPGWMHPFSHSPDITNDIGDSNFGLTLPLHTAPGGIYSFGIVGAAFDTTKPGPHIVQIPDAPNLSPRSLTFDAWFLPSFVPSIFNPGLPQTLIVKFEMFRMEINEEGQLECQVRAGDVDFSVTSDASFFQDFWNFAACTYDETTGTLLAYLNGTVETALGPGGSAPLNVSASDLFFVPFTPFGLSYIGKADEIELYDRDLTLDELDAIRGAEGAGKCPFRRRAQIDELARLHASVSVGSDSAVDEGASLKANSRVGEYSFVGASVQIGAKTVVGDNCFLSAGAKLKESIFLDDNVFVGERSELNRAGHVLDRVRIGANTRFGELARIDEEVQVGNDVNIGAAVTIGFATRIGNRVAIRDRVTLGREVIVEEDVLIHAGVTIGDGVRIPAGSIVTRDIR